MKQFFKASQMNHRGTAAASCTAAASACAEQTSFAPSILLVLDTAIFAVSIFLILGLVRILSVEPIVITACFLLICGVLAALCLRRTIHVR